MCMCVRDCVCVSLVYMCRDEKEREHVVRVAGKRELQPLPVDVLLDCAMSACDASALVTGRDSA